MNAATPSPTVPSLSPELQAKLGRLQKILTSLQSVLVAFSGGVDSSLLLKVARDTLADAAVAATEVSPMYSPAELTRARDVAELVGARHLFVMNEHLEPEVAENPPDRCYHCKKGLFLQLTELAAEHGLKHVLDGAQVDDGSDYRPGLRAAEELGVRAPLREAGLNKEDIRALSRHFGLPTADLPAQACYGSRFPYGSPITNEKLAQVAAAELLLASLGFEPLRVRHHGDMARIEVPEEQVARLVEPRIRRQVVDELKQIGFVYVTLDLQGFRSGSMNEALGDDRMSSSGDADA